MEIQTSMMDATIIRLSLAGNVTLSNVLMCALLCVEMAFRLNQMKIAILDWIMSVLRKTN